MRRIKLLPAILLFFVISKGFSQQNMCGNQGAFYDMEANNVKARINHNGSLFSDAAYIFPKPQPSQLAVTSVYSAGIWIGGLDESGNPVVSASTYRSLNPDFAQGPILENIVDSSEFCSNWNQFFVVKGENIYKHLNAFRQAKATGQPLDCSKIPEDVLYWPGQKNPHFMVKYGWNLPDIPLAGFWDEDGDGVYDACQGDFPLVPSDKCTDLLDFERSIPTEIVFYVFNDVMKKQSVSGSGKLSFEMQVHAFAFATDDALNDATFYQYKFTNKGTQTIRDVYTGFWMDPDLGCYADDYIGCLPSRNLGFIYNIDENDGINGFDCTGTPSYADSIPVLGVKLVKPPLVSKIFARDENGNILYENGHKILLDPPIGSGVQDTFVLGNMSSFSYMENCSVGNPDPRFCDPHRGNEAQFYDLLKGWTFENPVTNTPDKYVFNGDPNDASAWSMCSQGILDGDRRIMLSSGRINVVPGQSFTQTYALFSTFDVKHPCPDLTKFKLIDDKIQDLFDGCFENKLIGPDAPDLTAEIGDRSLKMNLYNTPQSNNYNWQYKEKIPDIPGESFYRFEGVEVYQVENRNVDLSLIQNPEYFKLVYKSDVQNGISTVFDWDYVINPDENDVNRPFIWQRKTRAMGDDIGLDTEFVVDEDQFATDNKKLINGREYHFVALAYGYNNYQDFDTVTGSGQAKQFIRSFNNLKVYSYSPKYIFEEDELQLQVIRLSGEGNPHQFLLMEDDMDEKILSPGFDGRVVYKTGYGPLIGRIVDPSKWNEDYLFELFIDGSFSYNRQVCKFEEDAYWTLRDVHKNEILLENIPLPIVIEYLLEEYGFALTVHNYPSAGTDYLSNYGAIGARVFYENPSGPEWFNTVTKTEIVKPDFPYSWIKLYDSYVSTNITYFADASFVNMNENPFFPFKNSNDGYTFFNNSFFLTPAAVELIPILNNQVNNSLRLRDLNNVDIIFTSDTSKWSKCMVVESANSYFYEKADFRTIGDAKNFELRQSPSIGKDGYSLQDGTVGFSYFPGYAIDVETGERLNIFFSENSVFSGDNKFVLDGEKEIGGDLLFNPISQLLSDKVAMDDVRRYIAGGQHHVYVTRQKYDGCASLATKLRKGASTIQKLKGVAAVTWCATPIIPEGISFLPLHQGLIPNDVRIQLRVDQSYSKTRKYNIERERDCETLEDRPVYWFTFGKPETSGVTENQLENVSLFPNPSLGENQTFVLQNIFGDTEIRVYDLSGKIVANHHELNVQEFTIGGKNSTSVHCGLHNKLPAGIYIVNVKNKTAKGFKNLKWVIF